MTGIEIRPLTTHRELDEVVSVQRSFWHDPSVIVHANMLWSIVSNGGSIIGAVKDRQVIGFVLSYLGLEQPGSPHPARDNLKLVSQRMAILPSYRGQGIGFRLKLAQREFALQQGITLVTWTFDPMISQHAYFNIRKLGAVARRFLPDHYGPHSPLALMGSSDRLLAEWWVQHPQTAAALAGSPARCDIEEYVDSALILNPTCITPQGYLEPTGFTMRALDATLLMEIPSDYATIVRQAPDLAQVWRQHSRMVLENTVAAGYAITDFVHVTQEATHRSYYVLTRPD